MMTYAEFVDELQGSACQFDTYIRKVDLYAEHVCDLFHIGLKQIELQFLEESIDTDEHELLIIESERESIDKINKTITRLIQKTLEFINSCESRLGMLIESAKSKVFIMKIKKLLKDQPEVFVEPLEVVDFKKINKTYQGAQEKIGRLVAKLIGLGNINSKNLETELYKIRVSTKNDVDNIIKGKGKKIKCAEALIIIERFRENFFNKKPAVKVYRGDSIDNGRVYLKAVEVQSMLLKDQASFFTKYVSHIFSELQNRYSRLMNLETDQ